MKLHEMRILVKSAASPLQEEKLFPTKQIKMK